LTEGDDARRAHTRGILFMVAAMIMLGTMDGISKHLVHTLSPIQIQWVRYVFFLGFAAAMAGPAGIRAALRSPRPIWQSIRALLLVTEMGFVILAFRTMPLADAHALLAIAPLAATALSVPMLGERVGPRRWASVVVAFAGVLLILRPGMGVMQPIAVVPVICALMFAVYLIMTRQAAATEGPAATLLYTAVVGFVGLTTLVPFVWVAPSATEWAFLLVVAVLGSVGHYLITKALGLAPASLLQPFGYTLLPWVALVGWLAYDDIPDLATITGATIVVASGLYALHRERVVAGE
jgi:drug/metabolite transporter (DMT)-like permease